MASKLASPVRASERVPQPRRRISPVRLNASTMQNRSGRGPKGGRGRLPGRGRGGHVGRSFGDMDRRRQGGRSKAPRVLDKLNASAPGILAHGGRPEMSLTQSSWGSFDLAESSTDELAKNLGVGGRPASAGGSAGSIDSWNAGDSAAQSGENWRERQEIGWAADPANASDARMASLSQAYLPPTLLQAYSIGRNQR